VGQKRTTLTNKGDTSEAGKTRNEVQLWWGILRRSRVRSRGEKIHSSNPPIREKNKKKEGAKTEKMPGLKRAANPNPYLHSKRCLSQSGAKEVEKRCCGGGKTKSAQRLEMHLTALSVRGTPV